MESPRLPKFPVADGEIPEAARLSALAPQGSLDGVYLVDGRLERARATQPVTSPIGSFDGDRFTRRVLAAAPALSAEESLAALAAAERAWHDGRGAWPTARTQERIEAVEAFCDDMQQSRELCVRLLEWEIGKSRKDAETEFDRTLVYVRDTIEAVKELDRSSARFSSDEGYLAQIRRAPLGITLAMGPFNYPLNETFTTLLPALIMGNPILAKLPRYGGLALTALLPAFSRHFPAGTVNVLQGDGATVVGPLMTSGKIDCLAFIGTSRVANILKRQHPRPNRLRPITGLEAKNPAVILADADLDLAVKECVAGALSFNGQRCTALKLLFVERPIAEEFVARVTAAVDALRAGMPWDPGAQLTPLPEEGKTDALAAFVTDATQKGARLCNEANDGGRAHGSFFRPAVLYPVTPAMQLYSAEQFGPIVPIVPFDSLDEIDAFMQASPYGQQVALFSRDPVRVAALIDALCNQVCRINLNTQCRRGPDTFPFTGRKDSAEGTLSVADALRCFSIRTLVATSASDENKELVGSIVSGRRSRFLSTDYLL